ncbi:MAG: hypothetical protein IJQ76_07770, partial [Prevotella sp.]|nr:hypothetical protein [Prevotella sp.]
VVLSVPNDYKDYVKIEGLKVTALQPYTKGFTLTASVEGTDITAETDLTIYSPATAINVNSGYETIEVYVGETTKLSEAIGKAFSLVPANSTSSYYYEVADKDVVSYDEANATFTPLKGGTTKITAIVSSNSALKAELTVKVLVKAGSIAFAGREYDMNVGETQDFTDQIEVYPEDAVFDWSKVVLSVDADDKDKVRIDGLKVTALLPAPDGITLKATVSGTDMTAEVPIYIYNPATAIKVNSGYETIEVYEGDGETLTEKLKSAITLEPANTTDYFVWQFEDETVVQYDGDKKQYMPLKGGTTKATAMVYTNRSMQASLTIKVLIKARSIDFAERDYSMDVGETKDFRAELSVYPEDAVIDWSKVVLSVDADYKDKVRIDGLKMTALQPATDGFMLKAAVSGTDLTAEVPVFIYISATDIKVNSGYETIEVYEGDGETLTEKLKSAITLVPANTTDYFVWHFEDETVVKYDSDKNLYMPLKGGTTKAIAMVYSNRSLNTELTIKVLVNTGDIAISADVAELLRVGVPATLTVKANNGSTLALSAVDVTDGSGLSWPLFRVNDKTQNSDGSVAVSLLPLAPGKGRIDVTYGEQSTSKDVTVGVATTLTQGWQWMTLYSDSEKDPAKVFGSNIYEVRSQTDLLAYEDGDYYGTLTIEAGKGYMVRASKNVAADKAFLQTDGKVVTQSQPLNLYNGWTWMGYPYVHAYTPAELKLLPTEGDRIVSKTGGFVEYADGTWTGTLTKLNPYEAYLYYNHKGADNSLTWQPESALYPGSSAATARETLRAAEQTFTLSYDPSPYRTNMTMVVTLNSQLSILNSHVIIGAFVDGECRGEGRLVNGLFFITVHANDGERVTFRLIDTDTNFEYTLNETVIVTRMLGTVKQPYQLTVDTQGIVASPDPSEEGESETYDLLGRKQSPSFRGVRGGFLLQRQADGQVKKVVVRNK